MGGGGYHVDDGASMVMLDEIGVVVVVQGDRCEMMGVSIEGGVGGGCVGIG